MALGAAAAAPGALWAAGTEVLVGDEKSNRAFGYKRSVSHWTVDDLEWEDLAFVVLPILAHRQTAEKQMRYTIHTKLIQYGPR